MLQKDYPVILPDYILTQEEFSPENCLFFDIETTGLSWKTSHLYLLGAVFYENEIWIPVSYTHLTLPTILLV